MLNELLLIKRILELYPSKRIIIEHDKFTYKHA